MESWAVGILESWNVGKFEISVGPKKLERWKLEKSGTESWKVFVDSPRPQESLFLVGKQCYSPIKIGKCRGMVGVAYMYICIYIYIYIHT